MTLSSRRNRVMRRALFVLPLGALMGCASMFETALTGTNNHVQMPHYSFVVPPDQGWRLLKLDPDAVVVVKRLGSRTCQMETTRIPVQDERRAWPATQLADQIRDVWKKEIIKSGALLDEARSEEVVGNKKYYTMSYAASHESRLIRGWEYVYLANEISNEYFVYTIYSESTPASLPFTRQSYCKEEFMETLKTLRVSP